ncbi:hypothetical protein [Colwellia sp. 12G3]|uniref:hypothetical protein n=1 Tax=Colwellia sp. 12G3 TaxID=2058299 RepID=UPI000C31FB70|nr:hypothetical protein [Colwellia sp. 12G3]PKI14909.1 hypothetical protein CXF71_14230 [Colwellia sp. 12G3]
MKLLNNMKVLTSVISVTCATILSLGYVSNAVAAKNHLVELGSNKMISLDLQSGADINIKVWDKQKVEIKYDDTPQNLDNYKIIPITLIK